MFVALRTTAVLSLVNESPEVLAALVAFVKFIEGVRPKGVMRGWCGAIGTLAHTGLQQLTAVLKLVDAHQNRLLMKLIFDAHVLHKKEIKQFKLQQY